MELKTIIETVKHDLDYFQEPRSEMQRGRAFEANKILNMLNEYQAQLQQHNVSGALQKCVECGADEVISKNTCQVCGQMQS